MSKEVPVVRPRSITGTVTVMAIFFLVIIPFHKWLGDPGIIWAGITLIIYSLISREIVFPHHRRGMRALRKKNWQEGIAHFEASIADLERNTWKDKLRYALILSPGSMTYREMALVNIGFSYAQLGEKQNAVSSYERCLRDYPGNGMATAALNLLNAQ